MAAYLQTVFYLICANLFMTFAWYAHLKNFVLKPLWFVILLGWGIAFFEYLFLIPANRIGYIQAHISLPHLKIIQELITLVIFVPFSIFYMGQPISWNYFFAGLCLMGAVYFIMEPL